MKKSFVIHCDSLSVIDKMTDEQVGKLFRKMKSYHNGNEYVIDDFVVEIAFEQFKNQFDRDLKKYESVCERNRENGKKGGRPKNNPNNPSGLSKTQRNPKKPKKADSDSDKDSDNKKDKDSDKKKVLSTSVDKAYGNPDINNCLEIIKSFNGGGIDGTVKGNRYAAKNLISKLKKIKVVADGKYSWDQYLKSLINIVIESDDSYYIGKIASPKRIHGALTELSGFANNTVKKKQTAGRVL